MTRREGSRGNDPEEDLALTSGGWRAVLNLLRVKAERTPNRETACQPATPSTQRGTNERRQMDKYFIGKTLAQYIIDNRGHRH